LPGAETATEEAAAAVIMTYFVVGCGRMLCDWFIGGGVLSQKVLWCVGGTGGHGKNDGITISITNAGAKRPTFKKWTLKSISPRWTLFKVHLDLVRMIFTGSYIGAVNLGKMEFLVHLAKIDFIVKMHPTFVTLMLAG
jgi:hypothetical protein